MQERDNLFYSTLTPFDIMAFAQSFHHRLFHMDDSKSPLYSTFVPAVLVFIVMYLRRATPSASFQQQRNGNRGTRRITLEEDLLPPLTSISSKWIHNCSTVLVGMAATYLTLMVLIECTIRVFLLKAGIGFQGPVDENNRLVDRTARQLEVALDHCIEKSLKEVKVDDLLDDEEKDANDDNDYYRDDKNLIEPSCKIIHEPKRPSRRASTLTGFCAICLDEFKPGDTVVKGKRDCCKSNKFHKACIHKWLRINDSCPCCRTPMLEAFTDRKTTTTHARYLRSQFRMRIDTANRLRKEIMTYFIDQGSAVSRE